MHFGTFSSLSKEILHQLAAIPHRPHLQSLGSTNLLVLSTELPNLNFL